MRVHHRELIVLTSIVDASMGGAFVALPADLELEIGATVTIDLGKTKPNLQEARVVRVSAGPPRGFAVAWSDLAPTARTALRMLIAAPRLERVARQPAAHGDQSAASAKRTPPIPRAPGTTRSQ